jgi:hypothetical protein
MALEVTVPVMLVDSVAVGLQGVDPVIVKLPPERVPVKLKDVAILVEYVIVPANAMPVCDTAI